MRAALTSAEVVAMLQDVCAGVVMARDRLTEADRMGDADHGVGMARGFEEARRRLLESEERSVSEAFRVTGMALMSTVGGAAGAVFGTLFVSGARGLEGRETLDGPGLARFLTEGLAAVQARGAASPGDKTMVDALGPAAGAAAKCEHLGEALMAASRAAAGGAEATRRMVARVGKMKSLGERSLGHPDPGALSLSVILEAMAGFVRGLDQNAGPARPRLP